MSWIQIRLHATQNDVEALENALLGCVRSQLPYKTMPTSPS